MDRAIGEADSEISKPFPVFKRMQTSSDVQNIYFHAGCRGRFQESANHFAFDAPTYTAPPYAKPEFALVVSTDDEG